MKKHFPLPLVLVLFILPAFGFSPVSSLPAQPRDSFSIFIPIVDNNYIPPQICQVGEIITDPANDVPSGYIDVLDVQTSLSGEVLTAVFRLRNIPATLVFDRVGVPKDYPDYSWEIYIDTDNNHATGDGAGYEYELSASHYVFTPGAAVSKTIPDGVQVNTWKYMGNGSWHYIAAAEIQVNTTTGVLTLVGTVPGINSASGIRFQTSDYNPGGDRLYDVQDCFTAIP